MRARRVLLVSTPVGALGSGLGGGVELTVGNVAQALRERGHSVGVIAPKGSALAGFRVIEVDGGPPLPAQGIARDAPITMPPDTLVGNFFEMVRSVQGSFDVIINFGYDWLGLYVTPFLETPMCHVVSMSSLSDAIDGACAAVLRAYPGRIAMHTAAQAATFPFAGPLSGPFAGEVRIIGNGIDLDEYTFCPQGDGALAWVARLSPEKGLEDAIDAATSAGVALRVWGLCEDQKYWQGVMAARPNADVTYLGFVSTAELQAGLGRCSALLVTPKWVEAFGNVVPEALACGVPVITYDRGGPAEMVTDGQTGYVVEPDSVSSLTRAIGRLGSIERSACRRQAERDFSLTALGERYESWIEDVLGPR